MRLFTIYITLFTSLLLPTTILAIPSVSSISDPVSVPLIRRGGPEKRDRSVEEWAELVSGIRGKYGASSSSERRRALNTVSITNQQSDTSYLGSIQVGTPPKTFNVVLDTGSADLWLGGSTCTSCDVQTTGHLFSESGSSTFNTVPGQLNVRYGSGQAVGDLGTDNVQLGQFQVTAQTFGVATRVSSNFLSGNLSGLMGLGFQNLASTGATPWWIRASTAWTRPQMSFYFTRFRNTQRANEDEPGGQFTMGGTNSSLYDGDINFIDLVRAQYWTVPMTSLGISGGRSISLSGSTQNAAIDTGTTLIGGPSSVLDQFYASIPGAARGDQVDGSLRDYYVVPCSANVQATLTFGGQMYTMSSSDLIAGTVSRSYCLGAFFTLDLDSGSSPIPTSSSVPSWVVGSAFLKNVYTVFQAEPAAVGFATLKDNVQSFGPIGVAGFSVDENGNTNGTIIGAAGVRRPIPIPSLSGGGEGALLRNMALCFSLMLATVLSAVSI